jgi:hypothetical protein
VIACVSDIHLLHPKTPTALIIDNLDKCFTNNKALCNVDMVVLAGDVFDREAAFQDRNVHLCLVWISRLLKLCVEHGIVLRVLNGTPSHDREQSISFVTMVESFGLTKEQLDFRYIDKVEVERIDKLKIDVLYVPDEVHYDTAYTWIDVQKELVEKGLSQVDYAFMHGLFEFQVPELVEPHIKHVSENYLGIVKEFIFIGHDHTPRINGRIGIQGSFDRLSHGEEHKKGYLRSWRSGQEEPMWEVVENKGALTYTTISCRQNDIETGMEYVQAKAAKLPPGSHVRVLVKKNSPLLESGKELRRIFPDLHWKVESKDKDNRITLKKDVGLTRPVVTVINPESIRVLMEDRVNSRDIPDAVKILALKRLKEIM